MADRICTAPGCSKPYRSSGFCEMHQARMRRYGTLEGKRPRVPAVDRFWSRVIKTDSCWLWTGNIHVATGYGRLSVDRKTVLAHRFAYELLVGPIPDGLHIDHLCRVRNCLRPDHLEAVPQRTNTLRGVGFAAVNAAKTECLRGHAYDGTNTYVNRKGERKCRACHRERQSRRYHGRDTETA